MEIGRNLSIINRLIEKKQSFAFYRLPEQRNLCFLTQTVGQPDAIYDIESLDGETGFVFVPFRPGENCPAWRIRPDLIELDFPLELGEASFRDDRLGIAANGLLNADECLQVIKDDSLISADGSPIIESSSLIADDSLQITKDGLQIAENDLPITTSFARKERFEAYANRFRTFMTPLKSGAFDKLVLSRRETFVNDGNFSAAQAFYKACKWYVHSYVYLCYTPQTGLWLGSTPEVLLSGEADKWRTVALAGTMTLENKQSVRDEEQGKPSQIGRHLFEDKQLQSNGQFSDNGQLENGQLPSDWSDKNKEEQEYVSAYIRKQLHSVGITAEEEGPYPVYAGALSHLKTDFRFSADPLKLGRLLSVLHPTPAVCGLPKEKAYQFIHDNEGYDRKYYSGFVGWINPNGKTDLYVNLRCLNLMEDQLTMYAGSGLLAVSDLEDEWQETEKKLQTMKRLFLTEDASNV